MTEHTEPATYGTIRMRFEEEIPGWTLRRCPDAVPGRRWTGITLRPLTSQEVDRGFIGAVYGPDPSTVLVRVNGELARRVRTSREWERWSR